MNVAKFAGNWEERLSGVFCVNYANKSVLDVGCNIGIVACEISKRSPASIRGCDIHTRSIEAAKAIFVGSPVPSRFEALDVLCPDPMACLGWRAKDMTLS